MAKNVIIMVGDGMGWEMARAAAIQEQITKGKTGATLTDFYTEGKGSGLSFQTLDNYAIATTSNTFIDGDKGNSALKGDPFDHVTGKSELREGFEFSANPAIVEGFSPELREAEQEEIDADGNLLENLPLFNPELGFNEDPILNAAGKPLGGNLPIYNKQLGGALPWLDGADPEYIKNLYPDSAGTATALYTGEKTYVGAIGVDIFEESIETLAEQAKEQGKSAGVVSSVPFSHATPAAAVAHVNQRNKYHEGSVEEETDEFGHEIPDTDNIFRQIVDETQPEVVLGGGHPDNRSGFRYISEEGYNELVNGEYDDVYTFLERGENAASELLTTASELNVEEGDRLFGLYGARGQSGNLPWRTADDDYSNTGLSSRLDATRPLEEGETVEEFIATEVAENPTLMDMTTAALDVLEDDQDGFWLMIEGGDIDWAAHDNNLDNMLGTTMDFADSVEIVKDWVEDNGGWEDNLLIVTADHDHYFTLTEDFPELLATKGAEALTTAVDEDGNPITETGEEGELVKVDNEDVAASGHYWGSDPNEKYGWGTHTTRPVPVYYQGDGSEVLTEFAGEGFEAYGEQVPGIEGFVDQVHIAKTMAAALLEDDTDTDTGNTDTDNNESKLVSGTPEADTYIAGIDFEGVGNTVFAGAGNDEIDLAFGGSRNRVDAGSGDDIIYVGNQNSVFGGTGDDGFDATDSMGKNRMSGGEGKDLFFLGKGDRALGGEGDDKFFVQSGGGNIISGGEGADQFWIVSGEIALSANTIVDFEMGTDVIGILGSAGLGIDASTLKFNEMDGNTEVAFGENTLAMLNGVTGLDVDTSVVFA